MEIINYIFYLGINYITFSVIWFFLTSLPRLVIRSSISNTTSSYILKTIQYYLIAVITSAATLECMRKNSELSALFVFSGGFILFIYLAGKLEKNKMLFLLKSLINKNQSSGILKYEPHLIGLVMILYSLSFKLNILTNNPLVFWFKENIDSIYKTPFLGSIISFFGIIFLLTMLLKGIKTINNYSQKFISILTGKPITKSENNDFMDNLNKMKNNMNNHDTIDLDDVYVDFEEVDDSEERKDKE